MRKYIIALLLIILVVVLGVQQVQSQIDTETKIKNKNIVAKEIDMCNNMVEQEIKPEVNQESEYIIMKATSYDLSIKSCGKSYSNPSRGITKDGYNLTNKSHSEAWTVSSNKFPLGTKLRLEFPESHKNFSGVYMVRDTGNFNKNVLDIYIGDFGEEVSQDAINFGRVNVKVEVIN